MKKKTLSGITNYADLLKFLRSNAANSITDEEAIEFYKNMPYQWQQTLLNHCQPSPEVEKTIVLYSDEETLHFLCVCYGLYPETISWAMEQDSSEVAERVVKNLKTKPSSRAEELMVRRSDSSLFKIWVEKFHSLDEETERILNQDAALSNLLKLYIELQS